MTAWTFFWLYTKAIAIVTNFALSAFVETEICAELLEKPSWGTVIAFLIVFFVHIAITFAICFFLPWG